MGLVQVGDREAEVVHAAQAWQRHRPSFDFWIRNNVHIRLLKVQSQITT